jgi:hypothetical protein
VNISEYLCYTKARNVQLRRKLCVCCCDSSAPAVTPPGYYTTIADGTGGSTVPCSNGEYRCAPVFTNSACAVVGAMLKLRLGFSLTPKCCAALEHDAMLTAESSMAS